MSEHRPLRILDTGVLEGRLNIALGQALVESHQAGRSPDTLRFLRFPPTVLVGRHQALGPEIDLDFCRARGIGTARRITGGGAIYLDPGQLGWELVISRRGAGLGDLGAVTRALCEAAAEGLGSLGVAAAFRPRNDIEVGGRKISGTGGFFDGDTLFFQGTVLVDLDRELMVSALRVPRAKLERRALDSAAQRVTTLSELLGPRTPPLGAIQDALSQALAKRLGLDLTAGSLVDEELARGRELLQQEIGREEFVDGIEAPAASAEVLVGEHACAGGTIRACLRLIGPGAATLGEALITGDFFAAPPRLVYDLEAALRRVPVADVGPAIRRFFSTARCELMSVTPDDFVCACEAALERGPAPAAVQR